MKIRIASCAATFLLGFVLTGASTRAQEKPRGIETGNDLYSDFDDCQAIKNGHGSALQEDNCYMLVGYVRGVHDVLRLEGKVSDSATRTLQQIIDSVQLYLAAHPEKREKPAVALLIVVLTEAYPPAK